MDVPRDVGSFEPLGEPYNKSEESSSRRELCSVQLRRRQRRDEGSPTPPDGKNRTQQSIPYSAETTGLPSRGKESDPPKKRGGESFPSQDGNVRLFPSSTLEEALLKRRGGEQASPQTVAHAKPSVFPHHGGSGVSHLISEDGRRGSGEGKRAEEAVGERVRLRVREMASKQRREGSPPEQKERREGPIFSREEERAPSQEVFSQEQGKNALLKRRPTASSYLAKPTSTNINFFRKFVCCCSLPPSLPLPPYHLTFSGAYIKVDVCGCSFCYPLELVGGGDEERAPLQTTKGAGGSPPGSRDGKNLFTRGFLSRAGEERAPSRELLPVSSQEQETKTLHRGGGERFTRRAERASQEQGNALEESKILEEGKNALHKSRGGGERAPPQAAAVPHGVSSARLPSPGGAAARLGEGRQEAPRLSWADRLNLPYLGRGPTAGDLEQERLLRRSESGVAPVVLRSRAELVEQERQERTSRRSERGAPVVVLRSRAELARLRR